MLPVKSHCVVSMSFHVSMSCTQNVILLAKVYKNFRLQMHNTYAIDPARLITSPFLATASGKLSVRMKNEEGWDTACEINLINKIEHYILFESAIRGG